MLVALVLLVPGWHNLEAADRPGKVVSDEKEEADIMLYCLGLSEHVLKAGSLLDFPLSRSTSPSFVRCLEQVL